MDSSALIAQREMVVYKIWKQFQLGLKSIYKPVAEGEEKETNHDDVESFGNFVYYWMKKQFRRTFFRDVQLHARIIYFSHINTPGCCQDMATQKERQTESEKF